MYLRTYCIISRCEQGIPSERYPEPFWYLSLIDLDGGFMIQASTSTDVVMESQVQQFVATDENPRRIAVLEAEIVLRESDTRNAYRASIRQMRVQGADEYDMRVKQLNAIAAKLDAQEKR